MKPLLSPSSLYAIVIKALWKHLVFPLVILPYFTLMHCHFFCMQQHSISVNISVHHTDMSLLNSCPLHSHYFFRGITYCIVVGYTLASPTLGASSCSFLSSFLGPQTCFLAIFSHRTTNLLLSGQPPDANVWPSSSLCLP